VDDKLSPDARSQPEDRIVWVFLVKYELSSVVALGRTHLVWANISTTKSAFATPLQIKHPRNYKLTPASNDVSHQIVARIVAIGRLSSYGRVFRLSRNCRLPRGLDGKIAHDNCNWLWHRSPQFIREPHVG
jgi:hypothetical protein